jgi:hypothetical protein
MAEISLYNYLNQWESESFIRSWQSFSYSTNSSSFMEKKVHYHAYSSLPLVPLLRQFIPVHTLTFHSRSTLIQPSHLLDISHVVSSLQNFRPKFRVKFSSPLLCYMFRYIEDVQFKMQSNLQQYMQAYRRHQCNKAGELLVFIVHLNLHNNFIADAENVQRLPGDKRPPVLVFRATLQSVCEPMLPTVCSAVCFSYSVFRRNIPVLCEFSTERSRESEVWRSGWPKASCSKAPMFTPRAVAPSCSNLQSLSFLCNREMNWVF